VEERELLRNVNSHEEFLSHISLAIRIRKDDFHDLTSAAKGRRTYFEAGDKRGKRGSIRPSA